MFLAGLHRAERGIAERLLRVAEGRPPWPEVDAGKALAWVEAKTGITLAASQTEAVRLALRPKLLVIPGAPGVGKPPLVNSTLKVRAARPPAIVLAAPTGRAAKRLSDATGREAKTLHR